MEDYALDIIIGKGPSARSIRLDLPKFTLIGATTRAGHAYLAAARPLRHAASGWNCIRRSELSVIVHALAQGFSRSNATREGALEIAIALARHAAHRQPAASSGVRDFARGKARRPDHRAGGARGAGYAGDGRAGAGSYRPARCSASMIEKFGGGPVGLDTLAATHGRGHGHHRGRVRAVSVAVGLFDAHAARTA